MPDLLKTAIAPELLLDEHEAQGYVQPGASAKPLVLAPRNGEEAAGVLSVAAQEGWTVLCAGAGTRITRNHQYNQPDVILTTRRMTAIVDYEPADLVLTAQAGVSLSQINAATKPHKQFLALDPPVGDAATLGGIAATGSAGPLRLAHGTPRDHVLGVEVVSGDARVLHFGGKVVKNVAGYDVVRPLVGSRGTLGFITRLSVRLRPLPESDQSIAIAAASCAAAVDVADEIVSARLDVVALEIISPALASALGMTGWTVLVRLHGNMETVGDSAARVRTIAAQQRVDQAGPDVWRALNRAECEPAWHVRLANLPSLLRETAAAAMRFAERGLTGDLRLALHAGDGIARVIAADASPQIDAAVEGERAGLAAQGGSLRVERSGRPIRDPLGYLDGAPLMAGIKRVFDPAGILMPIEFLG